MSTDTVSTEHGDNADNVDHADQADHAADAHDDHSHGPSDGGYVKIALFLVVVTGAEVALSYMIDSLGAFFIPLLLFLMAVKFVTVVSYFMHLKFDSRLFTYAFYSGLALAVAVYVVTIFTFNPVF